jgi:hypothetical protein
LLKTPEAEVRDAVRSQIWSLLNEAFLGVFQEVKCDLPLVKMQSGQNWNEAFPFRAYADFCVDLGTDNERSVVISFDIWAHGGQIKISADISRESGLILKELLGVLLDDASDEDHIVELAREVASLCGRNTALIRKELI